MKTFKVLWVSNDGTRDGEYHQQNTCLLDAVKSALEDEHGEVRIVGILEVL